MKIVWLYIPLGYLIFYTIFFSCSQHPKNKDDIAKINFDTTGNTFHKDSTIDQNCLMPSDSNEIVEYYKVLKSYLDNHDTAGVARMIFFPFKVDGDSIMQDAFILSYYQTIAAYLLRNTIPSSELQLLKRYEGFVKTEAGNGCYQYRIYNSFPELEFNVNFSIEKKNGSLKLTSLQLIG